jgi:hypothetical protein
MWTDDREFQLVTWSEDRTLRAWPIEAAILEVPPSFAKNFES